MPKYLVQITDTIVYEAWIERGLGDREGNRRAVAVPKNTKVWREIECLSDLCGDP